MYSFFLVFIGGGLGSIARFSLGRWVQINLNTVFPWGTLAVNIASCFILGLIVGLFSQKVFTNPEIRLLVGTGFCGGFSTFSTFSMETLELFKTGETLYASAYVLLSMTLCLAFLGLGMITAKAF